MAAAMRFMLAAKHPPGGDAAFGGVATWIETISKQLQARGHECVTCGPKYPIPAGRFDVGVIANALSVARIAKRCDQIIGVCHGIIPEERPSAALKTVYTSEDAREHWNGSGAILRQPIDLEFWTPSCATRELMVFYSYRAPDSFGLNALAGKLGLKFVWLKGVDAKAARSCLQKAALACASGRAALEAMACGAPTMICDWRDYNGGPLVCPSMAVARRHNYSGRGGCAPEKIDMVKLARETMVFQQPREYIERHHDANLICEDLLGLCSSL